MNSIGYIFDMDGVLIDSIQYLYKSYLDILSKYNIIGSLDEFNKLNGLSLKEICRLLKSENPRLPENLEIQFKEKHAELYNAPPVIPGVISIIKQLHRSGALLAIASSAQKKQILTALSLHDLTLYFKVIISGDDVECSKPNPEIYEKAASALNTPFLMAIDDSNLGVESSLAAGISCIQFIYDNPPLHPHAAHYLKSFRDFNQLINKSYKVLIRSTDLKLELCSFDLGPHQKEIDQYWSNNKTSEMFDGNSILCIGFESTTIKVFTSTYRTTFYLIHHPHSKLAEKIFPLGVCGILIDSTHKTLIGQRSLSVSQYPGLYEFPPSGNIEQVSKNDDYKEQLLLELHEETGIHPTQVANIQSKALIMDKNSHQLDIVCKITLNGHLDNLRLQSEEYSNFQIVSHNEAVECMSKTPFLPISEFILDLFKDSRC